MSKPLRRRRLSSAKIFQPCSDISRREQDERRNHVSVRMESRTTQPADGKKIESGNLGRSSCSRPMSRVPAIVHGCGAGTLARWQWWLAYTDSGFPSLGTLSSDRGTVFGPRRMGGRLCIAQRHGPIPTCPTAHVMRVPLQRLYGCFLPMRLAAVTQFTAHDIRVSHLRHQIAVALLYEKVALSELPRAQ